MNSFLKRYKPSLTMLQGKSEVHRPPDNSVSKSSSDVGTVKANPNTNIPKKPLKRRDKKYVIFKV